jgi:type IV pilus assembly protein PilM
MRLPRRTQTASGTIGLDIDGAYLAAAQVENGQVKRAASEPLPAGLVVDGEVVDADGLSAAIKDFVRDHGLPRDARLGVGNQQIAVRHLELPKIADRADREAAVRFQASEAMPMPLDDAVIDYSTIGEAVGDDGAPRERVVIVAARRPMISRFVEAVRRAGLKPIGVDLDAFALVRVLGGSQGPGPEATRAYCHLGGVTNLAVAKGDVCVFTRPLSARWEGEQTDVYALAEELRISMDYYGSQPDSEPISEVFVSGSGAEDEDTVRALNEQLPVPVTAAPPLGTLTAAELPGGENPYRHTVSVGLAMGQAA